MMPADLLTALSCHIDKDISLGEYCQKVGVVILLTLTHAAKDPKGLSCFEKQTAKHFLKGSVSQDF